MAGTGVSVGGAGMLRTRRRDVSVKPNRKLDRKSSRGMIYENEELRLRTIHINAEVEQGQNDIKKLRRENEQLRREIWSLRDEYDKLEEILKRQKSQGESDESEDRSEEEDDELRSDYSYEDEQEEPEKMQNGNESTTEEHDQEERLENAENQKISTEKMNSSSLHRLHVDFDDLSVVDEEEELKKDKDKKESNEENAKKATVRVLEPRQQLHDNVPFYPASYDSANSYTDSNYFSECPFEFPNTLDLVIQATSTVPQTVLPSPCPGLYGDPLMPLARLADSPILNPVAEPILPEIHMPPVGWQNNLVLPEGTPLSSYPGVLANAVATAGQMIAARIPVPDNSSLDQEYRTYGNALGLRQRRNLDSRQPSKQLDLRILENPSGYIPRLRQQEGWAIDTSTGEKNYDRERRPLSERNHQDEDKECDESYNLGSGEKPKHFFAPLPTKAKRFLEEESPTIGGSHYFGTGTSSSSGKTGSTVICGNNNYAIGQKGSMDVCVNGGIPYGDHFTRDKNDAQRTFLSTDNLLIESIKSTGSNRLTKSMSCQDLTSDSQTLARMSHDERAQTMTKSDNTLDSISSGNSTKAYRSHLNVTLKIPRRGREASVNTPEIPQLPSMDYRVLTNPFLRNIERTSLDRVEVNPPATKPLSVQVTESNASYTYPGSPVPPLTSFARSLRPNDRYRRRQANLGVDQNRLLIPTDQLIAAKNLSPSQDFQVTSFERPSPHTLLPSAMPYDLGTLRRINATRYMQKQNLYQNVPFVPACPPGHVCPNLRMYYDPTTTTTTTKVPAQTQTSIDGDSHVDDDQTCQTEDAEDNNQSVPNSPSGQRRKRAIKKDKMKDLKGLAVSSPHAQRKLKKQSSVTSTETQDSPGKSARQRARKLSVTTTTTSEALEDKNESRSSSSGQDSPRKDQSRRVSTYFNPKKRPSVTSIKTTRSGSLDTGKEKYSDGQLTSNSEKETMNSGHVREIGVKSRKGSTSSGKVPWCACWGNGCV